MPEQPISEQELHAFVDGELEPSREAVIAVELAAVPALAARVAAIRADKALIARVYGPLANEPLPATLLETVVRAANRRRPPWLRRTAWAIAAAAALAVVGWFGEPLLHSNPADSLVAEAMAVRGGERRPTEEYKAPALPPPEARDQLLRATLNMPLKTPDLGKAGFKLDAIGVYGDGHARRALELNYRDGHGRRFTVYLHGPTGTDGFDLRRAGGAQVCIWQNEELSAVMVGEMSAEEILRVASLTYADLNF